MTNTSVASVRESWREAWRAGYGLVWPVSCAGCGRPDVPLCPACRAAVAGPAFCTPMVGWPLGWGAWAACSYRGVPARLLIAWKERGRHDLTGALGAGLAAAVCAARQARSDAGGDHCDGSTAVRGAPPGEWLLVPVPSTRAARRRRGADLMGELSQQAAGGCRPGWPGPPPRSIAALRHVRRVRDQGELGAAARRANLRGALAVRHDVAPLLADRECVVVDDVVTTGTTAAEAARVLTEAGARVVAHCFLSVTMRRQGVAAEREED